jgi:fructokinase
LNFSYLSFLLLDGGVVASRVGQDRLGHEAICQLKSSGLDTSQIQVDPVHSTGTVHVELDSKGQPEYRITEDVAWDHLTCSSEWECLAQTADAICFGSLAQRSNASRAAIRQFLRFARPGAARIFDVNLRQAFFSEEILRESVLQADIVKVNHEELRKIVELFRHKFKSEVSAACWLSKELPIKLVCFTRGQHGSLLVSAEEKDEHPGFPVKVADTVGAGDAFTAALVHHWLRHSPLKEMNLAANRMGAWVSSQEGAMPGADETVLSAVK